MNSKLQQKKPDADVLSPTCLPTLTLMLDWHPPYPTATLTVTLLGPPTPTMSSTQFDGNLSVCATGNSA